jgi:DNA polymerase-3 subunit delta'
VHLAKQFAYALLCEQPLNSGGACGQCTRCLLVDAQTHPDFIMITQEFDQKSKKFKTSIEIEQIRVLVAQMNLKPQFDGYRVVIIAPADALSHASSNAFLKFLEEPCDRTVLILVSDQRHKLSATIKSRCQKLLLSVPARSEALTWLTRQKVGHEHAALVLSLAQGSPLLALDYLQDDHLSQRQACFSLWLAVAKQATHPVIAAAQWLNLSEKTLLFWLTTWVIDVMRCRFQTQPDRMYHPDLYQSLRELAFSLRLVDVYPFYDLLLQTRLRIETPINKQVLWEEILIAWANLNQRGLQ